MNILVINAGSSSLKYQLVDMTTETALAKGLCERIGMAGGNIKHELPDGTEFQKEVQFPSHKEAFLALVEALTTGAGKVIDSVAEIRAVGHRVLNGSELYADATIVTDDVLRTILSLSDLGPLHIPPQATAIQACREVFGEEVPMVAVFDTSFHQTMPQKAYMFGIPYECYEKYSVRRYGFHGTSHRYVSKRYFELTGAAVVGSKLITCHLGNGSSITAIKDGKSVDTSMGFTPLDGFIMGTRCGGIDPSVVTYIMKKEGLSPDAMSDLMNKASGFLGISGVSSDNRDIRKAAGDGNERAQLTLEMLVYQIKKIIGSYAAAMNGVDAIIFTGGIGENDYLVRQAVCADMQYMGLSVDDALNDKASRREALFSTKDSLVKAMVIPTNEEITIARDTLELISTK
jgi:acetate kinase